MTNQKNKLIDFSSLQDMLYGEQRYIDEFSRAAMLSFEEFRTDYQKHLFNRDEPQFRKAGHKIKPVAQMLGIQQLIDEYEHGKELIREDESQEKLVKSAQRVDTLCKGVLKELKDMCE